jgi:hypothetical protein
MAGVSVISSRKIDRFGNVINMNSWDCRNTDDRCVEIQSMGYVIANGRSSIEYMFVQFESKNALFDIIKDAKLWWSIPWTSLLRETSVTMSLC